MNSIKDDPQQFPDGAVTDVESCREEKSPEPSSELTPVACLSLFGAFVAMFCTVGFINAFGVFQEYYSQGMLSSYSESDIAWIGSFNVFAMFCGTLPVGYCNDKFGPKILLMIGSVTMLFGLFMMSLSHEFYQLFLTQGFLLGVGLSFVVLPAFAVIPHHFMRGRAAALGFTVSGSSLGGVIWPIALRKLLLNVGFGWGIRISAFIMLPLLAIACFTIRLPQSSANQLKSKPKPDFSVLKHPVLILLALGMFFIYLGLFSPFFYITSWTISLGLDSNMAFYMVSIINAASLFGRILPGFVADRIGAYNIMIASAATSGVICMCWTRATSIVGIIFLSLAYGFVSGAVISLQGACASQVEKKEQYGLAMGGVMSFLAIAGLIGTPINGQLLESFQYLGVSLFSGLTMLIGGIFVIAARTKVNSKLLAKA